MYWTLQRKAEIARMMTAETAALKDYKVRNKHNRAMREIARELTAGRGYVIATARELTEKYGPKCHCYGLGQDADKKFIFGVERSIGNGKIHFVAM